MKVWPLYPIDLQPFFWYLYKCDEKTPYNSFLDKELTESKICRAWTDEIGIFKLSASWTKKLKKRRQRSSLRNKVTERPALVSSRAASLQEALSLWKIKVELPQKVMLIQPKTN